MHKLSNKYIYFEEINPGLIQGIGSGLRILDVGCGYGALGEALKAKGNIVFGVDISKKAIAEAKERLDFATVGDTTDYDSLPSEIKKEPFDLIILADVIEHVYDPKTLLENLQPLLTDDGDLLISIPNIANWQSRLKLLFGQWNYTVSGIMDRSHIRFFTLSTTKKLLKAAGFEPMKINCTPYFTRAFAIILRNILFPKSRDVTPTDPTALLKSGMYKIYLRFVYPIESFVAHIWKRLFAYQFIVRAKKIGKK